MSGPADAPRATWQTRVSEWLFEAFGFGTLDCAPLERAHRFLEEALELAQACGCTRDQALELVDYVFGRPAGAVPQEVGGVLVTLGALCWTERVSMEQCGEAELARCWRNVDAIRAKAGTKPAGTALPGRDILSVQIHGPFDPELLSEALGEPWPRGGGKLVPGPSAKRAPDGYAYRYAAGAGNSTIRFGTGGGEVNGSRPTESVPYWLGDSGDLAGATPIDMVLYCPACGHQHIDAPEIPELGRSGLPIDPTSEWTNPPHRSHRCHACSFEWRPADVATRGVPAVKTRGQRDGSLGAMDASMAALNRIPAVAETLLLEILAHVRPPSARNGSWRVERGHCTEFDRAMTRAHMARGELQAAVQARPLPARGGEGGTS